MAYSRETILISSHMCPSPEAYTIRRRLERMKSSLIEKFEITVQILLQMTS